MRTVTLQDYKRRMLRVLVHIHQHLDEALALEDLANVACFSPYHFHRIFTGMVGETLQEHIRRLRSMLLMKTKDKIDLYRLHKNDYAAPKKPVLLDIAPAAYLAISGQGAPGGELFTASIGALYGMAFTIKMTRKFAGQQDYSVCKLEGRWWSDSNPCFAQLPKDQWQWQLCIRTPEFITHEELDKAAAVLLKRGKGAEVKRVSLETIAEGQCVQMLHVGPYDQEHRTAALMQAFAEKEGLEFNGRHHEIYLSDPRRVAPEKLKTILRHPVKPQSPSCVRAFGL